MSSDIGARIGIEGEAAYKASIAALVAQQRSLNAEMNATAAAFARDATSKDAAAAKNAILKQSIANAEAQIKTITGQLDKEKAKLNELGAALERAAAEHGENSAEAVRAQNAYNRQAAAVSRLETQLHQAESGLASMRGQLEANEQAATDWGETLQRVGDGAGRFADQVLSSVARMGAAVARTTFNAVVSMTKQSIEAYSEYEQLVGGVETLFGEHARAVQTYANNAYKTAGLSANEYMETVTGFSASLLQSLENDTAQTARVADMAITDMSDNANKMGTSMSSLQSAYQGFAKQQYNMLDNLKLGYGGTKSEMQRLLSDASKLAGVKYDINNLSDVYQAIHVIQEELGITGTTAKEASETISGSAAAMKSAWQNLLVGIADDNADFDALVDRFVDSARTAGENFLPRVETILRGIGKLAKKIAPQLARELPKITAEILPDLISSAGELIGGLATAFAENAPAIVGALADALIENKDAIFGAFRALIDGGREALNGIGAELKDDFPVLGLLFDHLGDKIELVIGAAVALKTALTIGDVVSSVSDTVSTLSNLFSGLGSAAEGAAGSIGGIGSAAATAAAGGAAAVGILAAYSSYMANKDAIDDILAGRGFSVARQEEQEAYNRLWKTTETMLTNAGIEADYVTTSQVYQELAQGGSFDAAFEKIGYTFEQIQAMTRQHSGAIQDTAQQTADSLSELSDSAAESADAAAQRVLEMAEKIDTVSIESAVETLMVGLEGFEEATGHSFEDMVGIVESGSQTISEQATAAVEAITGMGEQISAVMEALAASGATYGADFMSGLITGFNARKGEMIASATELAGSIRALLHFSRPDTGPLADYETWMPDFLHGLARGIDDNIYLVHDAIRDGLGDLRTDALADVRDRLNASMRAMSTSLDASMTLNQGPSVVEHRHSGSIRIDGVNDKGELTASVSLLMDELISELRREARS